MKKKFKITFTKVFEVEGKDKKSAIKEAEMLFKHYHMNEIPVKAVAMRGSANPNKLPKKLKDLAKFIKIDEVDAIVFAEDCFVYQYRINGTDCNATVYSKGKEIEDASDIQMELGELLRKKITNGYQGGTLEGRDVMNILSRFGVTCYFNELSPKSYLQADDQFDVEGGSDS